MTVGIILVAEILLMNFETPKPHTSLPILATKNVSI